MKKEIYDCPKCHKPHRVTSKVGLNHYKHYKKSDKAGKSDNESWQTKDTKKWKRLMATLEDGVKIYAVDGNYVRSKDIEFTLGDHHTHNKYVPKGEIWVEELKNVKDQNKVVLHEVVESILMRYYGEDYETAHGHANTVETVARNLKENPHPIENPLPLAAIAAVAPIAIPLAVPLVKKGVEKFKEDPKHAMKEMGKTALIPGYGIYKGGKWIYDKFKKKSNPPIFTEQEMKYGKRVEPQITVVTNGGNDFNTSSFIWYRFTADEPNVKIEKRDDGLDETRFIFTIDGDSYFAHSGDGKYINLFDWDYNLIALLDRDEIGWIMYPPQKSNPDWSSIAKSAVPYLKQGAEYIAEHPEVIKETAQIIRGKGEVAGPHVQWPDKMYVYIYDRDTNYLLTEQYITNEAYNEYASLINSGISPIPGDRWGYPGKSIFMVKSNPQRHNAPTKIILKKLIPSMDLDKYELTQRIKAKYPNQDKQSLYGRYVSERDLKPDIDAKEFYQIFDSVGPNMHVKMEEVDFSPTHIYKVTGLKVMIFLDDNGNFKFVDERGGTGSWPSSTKMDDYYDEIPKTNPKNTIIKLNDLYRYLGVIN